MYVKGKAQQSEDQPAVIAGGAFVELGTAGNTTHSYLLSFRASLFQN
jgi:hypothetical protein